MNLESPAVQMTQVTQDRIHGDGWRLSHLLQRIDISCRSISFSFSLSLSPMWFCQPLVFFATQSVAALDLSVNQASIVMLYCEFKRTLLE